MLREEEIKWYQCAKVKELLEGGGALIQNIFSSLQMGNIGKLGFFNFNMRTELLKESKN
jgi:hypothetical protein